MKPVPEQTITTPDGWTYTRDAFGDWRGVSPDGALRTRLKADYAAAVKDVRIGRLQVYRAGEWRDEIDRQYSRRTA